MTWRLSSGFDDIAVWRTIWEQHEHVVSRLYHTERKVAFQDRQGQWHEGDIAQARAHVRRLAQVETTMEVKRGKQVRPKKQAVKVNLLACPLRVTYQTNVRRKGPGRQVTRDVWLVEVRVLGVDWEPWLLLDFLAGAGRPECGAHLYDVSGASGVWRTVSNFSKPVWAGKTCKCSIGKAFGH